MEDDAGCMIEQQSGQAIRDTDTEQHLPTDLITEVEAATYRVPEEDNPTVDAMLKLSAQHPWLITIARKSKFP